MSRGTIRPTTRDQAVLIAVGNMKWIGVPPGAPAGTPEAPIGYRLEPGHNGGADPLAELCASLSFGNRRYTADCVGFVLHALGIDRLQPGYHGTSGEWLHCPSMIDDASHGGTYFAPVGYYRAEMGDILITRDHVGLILRPARGDYDHLVADCSPRHGRQTGIGTGGPWSEACRVLRYLRFTN